MIRSPDRQIIISLIDEHIALGGKRDTACKILGINQSTYFRWKNALKDTGTTEDLRFTAIHPTPANKLNADERDNVLKVLNSSEFADSSPHQVVAILADRGEYLASERTCYRLLKEQDALKHRSRAKVPVKRDPPTHVTTRAQSGLVLGYHLHERPHQGFLLLPLHDRRHFQPLHCGLGSLGRTNWRACENADYTCLPCRRHHIENAGSA